MQSKPLLFERKKKFDINDYLRMENTKEEEKQNFQAEKEYINGFWRKKLNAEI